MSEESAAVAEIERAAQAFQLRETALKQLQKQLRTEIDARAHELSFVAYYCDLARERQAQVDDAERTLRVLERQLEQLENDNGGAEDDNNIA